MDTQKNILLQPWAHSSEEVSKAFRTDRLKGLDYNQVSVMRKKHGLNRLREAKKKSLWQILVAQFKSLIVILLAAAAVLSFVQHDTIEGIAILAVIFINAAIGFLMELKAVRSSPIK